VLRERREALEVSVREVAETLNLSMTIVEAIEADDAERLPGTVFARGYVRAYARLLDLDPEPLLAYYPKAEALAPADEVPSEPPIWEWIRQRPGLVLGGAGGVLALMILVIAIVLWPDGPDTSAGDVSAVADGAAPIGNAAADVEAGPSAGAPGAAVAGESMAAAVEPAPGGVSDAVAPPAGRQAAEPTDFPGAALAVDDEPVAMADAGGDAAAGRQAEDAAAPDGARRVSDGARRITDGGDDRLAFSFSDDCWVEVKSTSGASLYSDLNRAGTELALVGQGPFRILLGYAPGATLVFNGEPVSLAPYTRNNVATLVLGQ
jgi:cytoskeleton protein RodZ